MRTSGGFILQVNALDSESAATLAADRIAQLVARSSVATSDALRPWRQVWIKGETKPHSIARAPRGVRVKALYREDQIFTPSDGIVDAAVDEERNELLARSRDRLVWTVVAILT